MKKIKIELIHVLTEILESPSSSLSLDDKEKLRKAIILIETSDNKEDDIKWLNYLIEFFKIATTITNLIRDS